jgi:cytochrome P450
MGDSILMSASNTDWSNKRKSLSQAFYKDKLLKMLEIVKECMREKVREWREKYVDSGKEMDLILETSKTFIKIFLMCAFGEDLTEKQILHSSNGVKSLKPLPYVLREVFHNSLMRCHNP